MSLIKGNVNSYKLCSWNLIPSINKQLCGGVSVCACVREHCVCASVYPHVNAHARVGAYECVECVCECVHVDG